MRIALPAHIDPSAFGDRDPALAIASLGGETMGTSWSVRFVRGPGMDPAVLRARITGALDDIIGEMSHWAPDSCLSRFNRAAGGQWMALPPDFARVMASALAMAERSDGAFDPAIGRIVTLWGFGPEGPMPAPTMAALEEARGRSGWRRLAHDAQAGRLRQPGGLALDLSGIAKGHAVDVVAERLAAAGVRHMLVEIGGELAGRGIKPDGEPWWVDLEAHPAVAVEPLRVALHGLAVATSGDYRRGEHTIDPRTGRPTGNGVVSVSVLHGSAMEADAWATTLTVLGARDGMALATEHRIAARMIAVADDGAAREMLTPALIAMLDRSFRARRPHKIIAS